MHTHKHSKRERENYIYMPFKNNVWISNYYVTEFQLALSNTRKKFFVWFIEYLTPSPSTVFLNIYIYAAMSLQNLFMLEGKVGSWPNISPYIAFHNTPMLVNWEANFTKLSGHTT